MNEPVVLPAEDLLLQQPPMRLLDEYFDVAPPEALGRTCFAPDGIFTAPDGIVSPAGLIEALAQTAAASAFLELCRATPNALPPAPGYLVGLRDFMFMAGGAKAGDLLELSLCETHRLGPARLYKGHILREGDEIVRGTLKVWQPEDDVPEVSEPGAWSCLATATSVCDDEAGDAEFPAFVVASLAAHLQVIDSSNPNTTEARLFIDPSLPPFAGHFPGNPILPGVCLIEAAMLLANVHASDSPRLTRIDNARFTRLVRPGDVLRLQATTRPQSSDRCPTVLVRIETAGEADDGRSPSVATISLGFEEP